MKKTLVTLTLAVAALSAFAGHARAGTHWSINLGFGGYGNCAPTYYCPGPVYPSYYCPPVYGSYGTAYYGGRVYYPAPGYAPRAYYSYGAHCAPAPYYGYRAPSYYYYGRSGNYGGYSGGYHGYHGHH